MRSGAGGGETETKNPRAHSRGLNAFMFCLNHGRMGEGREGPSVPGGGWPPARAARAVGGQRQRFSSVPVQPLAESGPARELLLA